MKYSDRLKKILGFAEIVTKVLYALAMAGIVILALSFIVILIMAPIFKDFDWSNGIHTTLPKIDITLSQYIIYLLGAISALLTTSYGQQYCKRAKYGNKYFKYAKENSPFTEKAAEMLKKYARVLIITNVLIYVAGAILNLRSGFDTSRLVSSLFQNAFVFLILYFFAFLSEKLEECNNEDEKSVLALYDKCEKWTKISGYFSLAFGIVSLILAIIARQFLSVETTDKIAKFLFAGTTTELYPFLICIVLAGTLGYLTLFYVNKFFAKSIQSKSIFDEKSLDCMKDYMLILLFAPIAACIVSDVLQLILFKKVSARISVGYCFCTAIAMFLLRTSLYARREQLALTEDSAPFGQNENKDFDSPFLN